jgi:hypothetical protein
LQAFSLGYGHVPLLGPEHLHEPFDEYRAWLESTHLDHSPSRFRRWVEEIYQSEDDGRAAPMLLPGPRRSLSANAWPARR